jgi:hypothetical protein
VRSLTGSQVPASANATDSSTSLATSASTAVSIGIAEDVGGFHRVKEQRDRIALLPFGDFLLGAIQLGVEHRVRTEAVGAAFEQERAGLRAWSAMAFFAASLTASTSMPSATALAMP